MRRISEILKIFFKSDLDERRKLILEGSILKGLFFLSIPIMINNLIQTIYNLTDTYFVGQISAKDVEISAITLVWPVIFFQISLTLGFSMAGSSIISQLYGSKDYAKCRRVGGQLIVVGVIASGIIASIGYTFCDDIVRGMGGAGDQFKYATTYMKIICLGMPIATYNLIYAAIKQGTGDTATPMVVSIISVSLNILLDYIFIMVLNLGVGGAAVATVIARGINLFIAFYLLHIRGGEISIKRKDLKPSLSLIKPIVKKGVPLSIGMSGTSLGFVVLNVLIQNYGQNVLAAFGVGNRISGLIIMPAIGIGGAVAIIAGQSLGGNKIERIHRTFKRAAVVMALLSLLGIILIEGFSGHIVGKFVKEGRNALMAKEYLRYIGYSIFFLGIFQVVIGVFQGIGHTKKAMYISLLRLWVIRLPLIYTLVYILNSRDEQYVWRIMFAGNFIGGIIAYIVYRCTKFSKLKKVDI